MEIAEHKPKVVNVYLPAEAHWPQPHDSLIKEFPNAIPLEVCNRIIELFNASKLRLAGRTGVGENARPRPQFKVSSDLDIAAAVEDNPGEWQEPASVVRDAIGETCERYALAIPSIHMIRSEFGIINTGLQLQHYPKGEGYFKPHIDRACLGSSARELACIMYFNDVEEGGETCFPIQRVAVKPEAGKIVWFPAGFTHPHEGKTPLSGMKLIATSFMSYADADYASPAP